MADGTSKSMEIGKTDAGFLTDCWYFAALSSEIKTGRQISKVIVSEPVVIGRDTQGKAFALRDVCPHRLVPLSAGKQRETNGEPTLECPYHGWRFGTEDGVCKHMPSLVETDRMQPERVKVRRYKVHEANGVIYIYVSHNPKSTDAPCIPPPDFGALPDKPGFVIEDVFNAHMDDAVVGLMDPAHVPFVHNQWWWRPPSAGFKIKEKAFEPIERGWQIARHTPSSNSKLYSVVFGKNVTTAIYFQLPGFRWEVVENDTSRFLTLTCLTPEAPKKTRITQISWWSNLPMLHLLAPLAKNMGRTFLAQDGRMVDLQNKGMEYQKNMLWIDDIDVQAKWYQALKRQWVKHRSTGETFENPVKARKLKWRS